MEFILVITRWLFIAHQQLCMMVSHDFPDHFSSPFLSNLHVTIQSCFLMDKNLQKIFQKWL